MTRREFLAALGRRGELFAHDGRNAAGDQVDGTRQLSMRQRGTVHHERDSRDAGQRVAGSQDLRGDLVGGADQQRAVRGDLSVELGSRDRPPSTLLADRTEGARITREKVFGGLVRSCCDVAKAVDTDLQAIGRESSSAASLPIAIEEPPKAPRFAADDRDYQGKAGRARANVG